MLTQVIQCYTLTACEPLPPAKLGWNSVLWEVLGPWRGSSHEWDKRPYKPQEFPHRFYHVRTQQKRQPSGTKDVSPCQTRIFQTLSLNFSATGLRKKFPVFRKHSVHDFFFFFSFVMAAQKEEGVAVHINTGRGCAHYHVHINTGHRRTYPHRHRTAC